MQRIDEELKIFLQKCSIDEKYGIKWFGLNLKKILFQNDSMHHIDWNDA